MVFAKVVEARSFTGAGKLLSMPRSTVSRRVAQLERHLGARLIHRTTRKLQLTEIGAAYYAQCASGLAQIDEAEDLVKAAHAAPRGRVRVTAPVDIGVGYLAEVITRFTRRYPEVHVDMELTQRLVDMVGEGFDLALRGGSLSDSTLVARKLGGGALQIYGSPRYLDERGAPATVRDLEQHCCVLAMRQSSSSTWKLTDGKERIDVPVSGPLSADDFAFAKQAVIAGAGLGLLPQFFCRDEVSSGRLLRVLPRYQTELGSIYVVYPSAKHLSTTVRALRDFIVDNASELLGDAAVTSGVRA
jgi:DNA-binding transcriptional LysR family regulator